MHFPEVLGGTATGRDCVMTEKYGNSITSWLNN